MKIIDYESHFYSDTFFNILCSRTEYPYCEDGKKFRKSDDFYTYVNHSLFLHTEEQVEARLQEMDDCGVSVQVLGTSQGMEEIPVAESIECMKATNDLIYNLSKKYPNRFLCFGAFPVGDTNAAILEMERCKKELGFIGWMTHSNYRRSHIDEPQYLPLLAAAERLQLPVYIHPNVVTSPRFTGLGHTMAAGAMGYTIDTAITIGRLVFMGIFDRFPSLQVILGHLGEGLPFYLDRMDKRTAAQNADHNFNKREPSYYFKHNIWVTTSGVFSNPAFECTKAVLGIDRILFGSDYPFESLKASVNYVKELELSESDRAMVCYKNSERLIAL